MYVQRNTAGKIMSIYGELQQGFAEEYLEPDDPELVAFHNPPAPELTPLQKIRALEDAHQDAQAKLTRQALIAITLDKAMLLPAASGKTRAEVHLMLMALDTGYAGLYNLEQQVALLRQQL